MLSENPFFPKSIEEDTREVLTADDVARYLRLRPSTVADLARRGVLPSVKFGRARRYLRVEIADFIEQSKSAR